MRTAGEPATIAELRRHLTSQVGLADTDLVREPIRVWRLSGVERLRHPDGASVVFTYALPPFTGEHRVLAHLAEQTIPVLGVRAATIIDGTLGMILEDLGAPLRDATEQDAAAAAVKIHTASQAPWPARLGEADLVALPGRAPACLDQLRAVGRFTDAGDLVDDLRALDRIAAKRPSGAERPPFGFCHGELHPTAVHISRNRWHLLDLAMAFTGPGLLDLAAWSGLRLPTNPTWTRRLVEHYVHTGDHPDALADRGGLPAERWVLGRHRVQAAHWLLDLWRNGVDPRATDPRPAEVLRRQLLGARDLLGATPVPGGPQGTDKYAS